MLVLGMLVRLVDMRMQQSHQARDSQKRGNQQRGNNTAHGVSVVSEECCRQSVRSGAILKR